MLRRRQAPTISLMLIEMLVAMQLFILAEGQIFTSTATVCDSFDAGATISGCKEKLLAQVFAQDGGSDWAISATIDRSTSLVANQSMNLGSPQGPTFEVASRRTVRLVFSKQNSAIVYPLKFYGEFNNKYVGTAYSGESRYFSSSAACQATRPAGISFVSCCPSTASPSSPFPPPSTPGGHGWYHQYYLATNQSASGGAQDDLYRCYTVQGGSLHFTIAVNATITQAGSSTPLEHYTANLGHNAFVAGTPYFNASLLSSLVSSTVIRDFTSQVLCQAPSSNGKLFYVPLHSFGSTANKIGITDTSFGTSFRCPANSEDAAWQQLTAVDGGSVSDQFSAFRHRTMSWFTNSAITDTVCDNGVLVPNYAATGLLALSVKCNRFGSIRVLVEMEATTLKLIKLYALPKVVGQSQQVTLSALGSTISVGTSLAVEIVNDNVVQGTLEMKVTGCTWIPNDATRCLWREILGTTSFNVTNATGYGVAALPTVIQRTIAAGESTRFQFFLATPNPSTAAIRVLHVAESINPVALTAEEVLRRCSGLKIAQRLPDPSISVGAAEWVVSRGSHIQQVSRDDQSTWSRHELL